ncbi:hypothetical protein CBR_g36613 [Chara braunii]|uniref:Reverse transcriptase domain-containing protein n=1 Tax=Chara braunii TaxID=69332 RepID=A0A388JZC7_CHABU|nr:hypothetical protein CBR_g36613 [Chara braunii]|eukprot:GBG63126.1 hypothetical protein CBR_g36613 [Chara braunii]
MRLVPRSTMASVLVALQEKVYKFYFSIMDARVDPSTADALSGAGVRWFLLDAVRERNSQELEEISITSEVSALLLLNLNEKLLEKENLHSNFLASALVEPWRTASQSSQSQSSRGSSMIRSPAVAQGRWADEVHESNRIQNQAVWSPVQGTRGGVAILLHKKWLPHVIDSEADLWGRWVWLRLRWGQKDLVIMGIYAPSEPSGQATFFKRLQMVIPEADSLLVAGDWNVSLDDAMTEGSSSAGRSDAVALLDLLRNQDLADPFRMLNPDDLGYTWFSHIRRDKGEKVLSVNHLAHPISDHKAVVLDVLLDTGFERGRGHFKFNNWNLEEQEVEDWVKEHMRDWQSVRELFPSSVDWLDGGVAIISGIMDVCSRILARDRNREEADCKKAVERAEWKMEQHPVSELLWAAERERSLAKWDKLQLEKHQRWEEALRVKGVIVQDRLTKDTFQRLLPNRDYQQVVQLNHPFDERAVPVSDPGGMLEYARLYYADVLSTRRTHDTVHSDLSQEIDMWADTAVVLTNEERLSLDRPITMEEGQQTLRVMASGKCPGVDGLTVEFYRKFWNTVGRPLVEVYNDVLTGGRLGKGMTHGVISLMFKKGDKANVRNYRPISVLNVDYKILAKTLALRLGRLLASLVERDQGDFVQGRSIFVNILTAIEFEVVQAKNREVAVLLLDLEKVYDRVGWAFVLATLRKMGFGEGFCRWVIAMYTLSTSAVFVNGHLSQSFQLSRSLRQGCPPAPLLFVLQLEVPLNCIRKHQSIRGIQISTNKDCRVKALADDLFMVSENSKSSLEAIKTILMNYSQLSEALVNWNKSAYILPTQYSLQVEWGMQRVDSKAGERFLGVLVSLQIMESAQGLVLQQRLMTKLRVWGSAWHLSLFGRALVINVALFSLIWYVGTVSQDL